MSDDHTGSGTSQDQQTRSAPRDPAEIQAEIERTREELAETVDQLAARLDVKARARAQATRVKDLAVVRARNMRGSASVKDLAVVQAQNLRGSAIRDGKPTPQALAAGGVALAAIAAAVVLVLRTRSAPRSRRR